MTGYGLLDWAVRALSVFDTIALLWLGLTILLTTERRRWGAWLAGGGLLAAGLLVATHAVLIESDLLLAGGPALMPWWRLAWLVLFVAPALWLMVMVWFSGWVNGDRGRLALVSLTVAGAVVLSVLSAVPDPAAGYLSSSEPTTSGRGYGASAALAVAVTFGVGCIILAMLALRRPGGSDRFMGDLARRRARPWLVATSLVLLGLVLLAGLAATWLVWTWPLTRGSLVTLAAFDLLLQVLVATTVVLLGQAIVAYEVFTGQTLPRRGLRRHWHVSLMVAAAAGMVIGASLSLPVAPMARLLLVTVLMALGLALLNWRAFVEREQAMARLRPFVASQHLVDRALDQASGSPAWPHPGGDTVRALREDILGARFVALVALGPLAPLVGPPLVDPPARTIDLAGVPGLAATVIGPDPLCRPLPPGVAEPARWATPLWGDHGLSGLLLFDDKYDGALYTQEEIEVARAAGERLLDSRAGAELARRLVVLQRQRLAESQVVDRQTRRVLHDEVLPRAHAALLALADPGATGPAVAAELLGEIHRELANLLRALPSATAPDLARLGLLGALRQVVDGELAHAFDGVTWEIAPAAAAALADLPPLTGQVLFGATREVMRNAARHGRDVPGRPLHLAVVARATESLVLEVDDDGVGFGASGGQPGGSGQGLAFHETMLAIVGGALVVDHAPAGGVRVTLTVPRA